MKDQQGNEVRDDVRCDCGGYFGVRPDNPFSDWGCCTSCGFAATNATLALYRAGILYPGHTLTEFQNYYISQKGEVALRFRDVNSPENRAERQRLRVATKEE